MTDRTKELVKNYVALLGEGHFADSPERRVVGFGSPSSAQDLAERLRRSRFEFELLSLLVNKFAQQPISDGTLLWTLYDTPYREWDTLLEEMLSNV